jgi:protein-disulfide isomerase
MSSRVLEKQQRRAERESRERAAAAAERRSTRIKQMLAALGAAVVVVVALVLISQSGGGQRTSAPEAGQAAAGAADVNRMLAGIPQRGTVLGDPKAKVTLTEFADLQCPFCGEAATQSLPTVIDRYVRTGKVKLDLRLLSFLGPDSEEGAAAAAAAAEQNKMWQFAELFYRNQGKEDSGYVTESFLRKIAQGVSGLDAGSVVSQASGAAAQRQVAQWTQEGDAAGVRETPTFFLQRGNGRAEQIQIDPRDPGSFGGPIDRALAR